MIPDEKQAAVKRAMEEAFGVSEYDAIQPLSGGLSTAQAFQISIKGKHYLLKILRKEVISDPKNEFECMQAAGQAGIAPRVWYASVEERLLISDFVEASPFPPDMAQRMAGVLRRLHALPPFERPKMGSYFGAMDGLVRRFQAAQLLPESATEEVLRRYGELMQVYLRQDGKMVSSHNDVKPQNIRYDGKQLWLVDWESAFLNDENVDLAIVANFFVNDEADEEQYLQAYFGEPAGEYRAARFTLARQAVSMFYAALLLLEAGRAGLKIAADMPVHDWREYHQELTADKIDMLKADAKAEYGMIHLRSALRNMQTRRFEEAMEEVRNKT